MKSLNPSENTSENENNEQTDDFVECFFDLAPTRGNDETTIVDEKNLSFDLH
jgi:hypothetical protein